MFPILAVCFVFIGCCSNVYFLELLVSEYPGSGNMITFTQFLFIAVEGFIFTSKFGTKKPVVPLSYYFWMVSMFFVVQVSNNLAFSFNISMPLHMIFRSGSLAATLVLGIVILKRKYAISKYISVGLISMGIIVSTIASANQVEKNKFHTGNAAYDYFMWLIGIAILVFALFMSSRMGIFQEQTYAKYGKHPAEAMFYNHALPLPAFALMYKSLYETALIYNASEPVLIPLIALSIPKLWLYILMNMVTQYVCIRSVFVLTTECTSLVVTLIVTLRKFVSLLFSIYHFQNPFTVYHWIGTSCVFIGTLIFTEVINLGSLGSSSKKDKKAA